MNHLIDQFFSEQKNGEDFYALTLLNFHASLEVFETRVNAAYPLTLDQLLMKKPKDEDTDWLVPASPFSSSAKNFPLWFVVRKYAHESYVVTIIERNSITMAFSLRENHKKIALSKSFLTYIKL